MHARDNVITANFDTVSPGALGVTEARVHDLCRVYAAKLPFHGWHHVSFVKEKAVGFARHNGSDQGVVAAAALVHDVNYLVRRNSAAAEGRDLRMEILLEAGVPEWWPSGSTRSSTRPRWPIAARTSAWRPRR